MVYAKREVRFTFYAGAIFTCYFIFGIFQEKVTRGKYGDNDKFTCTLTLVLIQCVTSFVFAKLLNRFVWEPEPDHTRTSFYISSALTYLLGMVCSNMALQWVNYPTQVVGKAAKPIPVMILGVVIGRKRYPLKKYLFVLLIVVGIILFMFKDQAKVTTEYNHSFDIGELLLVLSLTMDGLTGAIQERIKSESSPTGCSMMLNTNWWSTIILSVGVLFSGEILQFIYFVNKYPDVMIYIGSLALMGALGQMFIFFMVSEFGPLPCSIVTTTRKFFTMLVSVIFFGNSLSSKQWLGAIIVFAGLFLDIFYGKSKVHTTKPAVK